MTEPRNPRVGTRGKPFQPGNPGRVRGSRNQATKAAEALLDGEADALTRKAIDMALAGDSVAMRLCLERLVPARKDRPIVFDLPAITGVHDHPAAISAVLNAVAAGDLTPSEAQAFAAVMEQHRRSVETADIDARLKALEGNTDAHR